jgi:hypothetical protein
VESSCECGYEPSGSIKCWETIKLLHKVASRLWNVRNFNYTQRTLGYDVEEALHAEYHWSETNVAYSYATPDPPKVS